MVGRAVTPSAANPASQRRPAQSRRRGHAPSGEPHVPTQDDHGWSKTHWGSVSGHGARTHTCAHTRAHTHARTHTRAHTRAHCLPRQTHSHCSARDKGPRSPRGALEQRRAHTEAGSTKPQSGLQAPPPARSPASALPARRGQHGRNRRQGLGGSTGSWAASPCGEGAGKDGGSR